MSPEYVRPYVKAQKNDVPRRRGDRGGIVASNDAFCSGEERDPVRLAIASSGTGAADRRTDGAHQPSAGGAVGTWDHRGPGASQAREGVAWHPGGRGVRHEPSHSSTDQRSPRGVAYARHSDYHLDAELVSVARTDEAARRLASVPGIGTINATALVAAVGDGSAFARGRDMAAWLGLVPRQATTGGKPRLLGISKRRNRYLRKNLIHGPRSVLPYLVQRDTPLGRWVTGLMTRAHKNTVVVALANKLARIAWAVLVHGRGFDASHVAA